MVAPLMHSVIIPIDEAPFRVLRFTIVRSTATCQASPFAFSISERGLVVLDLLNFYLG